MSKPLLNPQQCAEILGVTRPGFVKMFKRGDIKSEIEVGRQAFFTKRSVGVLKRKLDQKNGKRKPAGRTKGKR